MPTLAFPSGIYGPSSVDWRIRANTQSFRSPLDGSVQTIELPGSVWTASVSWNILPPAQWRALQAWLAQLRGAAGRFYYGPPHATTRQAVGSIGTPLVNGPNQTGVALACDGFGASAQVFLAGDFIAYDHANGRSLHVVTATATANGSGQATLAIEPPIRTSPADNAALIHASPTCVMRLVDDETGALQMRPGPGAYASLQLEIVEALG